MSLIINDNSTNDININNNNEMFIDDSQSKISKRSSSHSVASKSSSNSLNGLVVMFQSDRNSYNNIKSKQMFNKKNDIKYRSTNIKEKLNELYTETKINSSTSNRIKQSYNLINKVNKKNLFPSLNNTLSDKYHGHYYNYSSGGDLLQNKAKQMLIGLKSKKMEVEADIEEFKNQFDISLQRKNSFGVNDFEKKFKKESLYRERKKSNTLFNYSNNTHNNFWLISNPPYANPTHLYNKPSYKHNSITHI